MNPPTIKTNPRRQELKAHFSERTQKNLTFWLFLYSRNFSHYIKNFYLIFYCEIIHLVFSRMNRWLCSDKMYIYYFVCLFLWPWIFISSLVSRPLSHNFYINLCIFSPKQVRPVSSKSIKSTYIKKINIFLILFKFQNRWFWNLYNSFSSSSFFFFFFF